MPGIHLFEGVRREGGDMDDVGLLFEGEAFMGLAGRVLGAFEYGLPEDATLCDVVAAVQSFCGVQGVTVTAGIVNGPSSQLARALLLQGTRTPHLAIG